MFHQRVKKNVEQVFDVNVFLKVTPFAEIPCPSNRTEFLTNLIYKLSFVKWLFKEHDFTVLLCPFNTDTSGFATKRKTRRIFGSWHTGIPCVFLPEVYFNHRNTSIF